ncbi:MAG: myo-inosose-2 dehydratase [Bacillota bacterium]
MRKGFPFKLGISAINWANEDVLRLGDHYTGETILSEMASLGYEGTEMSRKFPQEVDALKSLFAEFDMSLATQWKGVMFSDRSMHESELEAYREHVLFLKEMGCKTVVTCELGGSTIGDPRRDSDEGEVRLLSVAEWDAMVEGLEKAGQICKEHGLELVYHHHMGTNVETREEIDRLMETTNPELVNLLFDSGHAYYGGADPLPLLETYYDRIKHVHLKDVRQDVLDQVRIEQLDFKTSVLENVFTVPGDGVIDFAPILKVLKNKGYLDWVIIEAEQDPDVKNPYEHAKLSKDYLKKTWLELD